MKTMKHQLPALAITCCALTLGQPIIQASDQSTIQQNAHPDIELAGLFQLNGNYSFSLYHAPSKASKWVDLGRSAFGYEIESYNPQTDTLTVSANGHPKELRIRNADDTPLELPLAENQNEHIEYIEMSTADIAPELPGTQSLHALKSKLRYSVAPRKQINKYHGVSAGINLSNNITPKDNTAPSSNIASKDTENSLNGTHKDNSLTESELIALSLYEKNHVVVREPPRDLEITYSVSPR